VLARVIFHEVEEQDVVEERVHLSFIFEVDPVVQLGELQDYLNGFGFVIPRQTAVALAVEDAFAALVDQVGTYWILSPVQSLVKRLLFRKQHHGSVVTWVSRSRVAAVVNCTYNITPNVWSVVPVKVNDVLSTSRLLVFIIG